MADFAARKCRDPREFEAPFTPLNIVDKLLAKEGEFMESEGHSFSFGGFSLNYPVVRPVREKALAIIDDCLNTDDPKIALSATKSISRVLSGYLPMVGRAPSDDEVKWQTEERLTVLDIVEKRLEKATPTPLLRQIRSVLRPRSKDTPLGRRINEALLQIPQSDDLLIFDAFSTGEWDHDGFYENLEDADKSRKELIARGVAAFRAKFSDGRQQVGGLVQLVKDAEECGIEVGSKSYSFIAELCSEDFVQAFLTYAMNDPHPLLAYMTIVAFRWLRASDLARYQSSGIAAATHKNHLLAFLGLALTLQRLSSLTQNI
jgi:hypothetical protein